MLLIQHSIVPVVLVLSTETFWVDAL